MCIYICIYTVHLYTYLPTYWDTITSTISLVPQWLKATYNISTKQWAFYFLSCTVLSMDLLYNFINYSESTYTYLLELYTYNK